MNHGKAAENESLAGKHVVVIGGGDTGNDCLGTAMRQRGLLLVRQLEITPRTSTKRLAENPWPEYPMTAKIGYESGRSCCGFLREHTYHSISTTAFVGAERGQVVGIETVK